MTAGGLLVLAVGPGLFWLACVFVQQYYRPIPVREVVYGFALGLASTIPAGVLESVTGISAQGLSPGGAFLVGLIEEGSKFAFFLWLALRSPYISESLGGIVLSSSVALGFASAENIEYALMGGATVAVLRGFTSTLGHVFFSSAFGFAVGRSRDPRSDHRSRGEAQIPLAIGMAAFAHGLYDASVGDFLFFPVFLGTAVGFVLLFRWSQSRSPYRKMTAPVSHRCAGCGFDSPQGLPACPRCQGTAFTSEPRCGRCSGRLRPDAAFCTRCGTRVIVQAA